VLGELSAAVEANGCCSSLSEKKLSSSSDYIAKLSGVSRKGHETQAELLMVHSDIQELIFTSWTYHFK
jgi:hypothetical protein